jgi:hypothetical protein
MPHPAPLPPLTVTLTPEQEQQLKDISGDHDIAFFYGYAVTRSGQIFSIKGKKPCELKGSLVNTGYRRVGLSIDGKIRSFLLHRIVAQVYVPKPPDSGDIVRHLDGDRTNNHYTNLAWGTPKENSQDAVRHGAYIRGESVAVSKLTEQKVHEIRESLEQGESLRTLGKRYGVSRTTIWFIKHRVCWNHC